MHWRTFPNSAPSPLPVLTIVLLCCPASFTYPIGNPSPPCPPNYSTRRFALSPSIRIPPPTPNGHTRRDERASWQRPQPRCVWPGPVSQGKILIPYFLSNGRSIEPQHHPDTITALGGGCARCPLSVCRCVWRLEEPRQWICIRWAGGVWGVGSWNLLFLRRAARLLPIKHRRLAPYSVHSCNEGGTQSLLPHNRQTVGRRA